LQRHILATKYTAFADLSIAEGGNLSCGDIVDMHQIEAGIDNGGDAATNRPVGAG
jgi:hypothetical protein